jgi:mRNA interferase RelE/StbE
MNVEFRNSFTKDLKGLSDKSLLKRIKNLIERIEQAESLRDVANLKKLNAGENYFRLRIGEYRLGFVLEKEKVIFVRFLHRKEIYKFFP